MRKVMLLKGLCVGVESGKTQNGKVYFSNEMVIGDIPIHIFSNSSCEEDALYLISVTSGRDGLLLDVVARLDK